MESWSHGEHDRMTLDGVVRDCRVLVRIEPCEKSIIRGSNPIRNSQSCTCQKGLHFRNRNTKSACCDRYRYRDSGDWE